MTYSGRRLGLSIPGIVQSSSCPVVRDTVERSQMLELQMLLGVGGVWRKPEWRLSWSNLVCWLVLARCVATLHSSEWGMKYQVLLTIGQRAKN